MPIRMNRGPRLLRGIVGRIVPVLTVTVTPVGLVGQPSPPTSSGFRAADCPFPPLEVSEGEVSCGFLSVPEDRSDPASRTIEIALGMLTPPNAAADPVVLLPGGPGGAPLPRFLERVRAWVPSDRTVIVFDPRGTGFSGGPLCPELGVTYREIAALDLSRREARAVQDGAQRACRNQLRRDGVAIESYNSVTVAQDLVDLRVALGIEQWNLLSVSYGVPFARELMRTDSTAVRSAVLALGPPPDLSRLLSRDVPFFRRAFRRVADGCARGVECGMEFPDLEHAFVQVVEDLRDDPITLDVPPSEFRLPRFTVNAQDFAQAIYFLLASESDVAFLPSIIRGFSERDPDVVRGVVDDTWGGLASHFSSGMALSVMCYDAATPSSEAEWEEAGIGLPDAFGEIEFYLSHCGFWHDARASPEVRGPARLSPRTLVVSGEYDPMNPPQVGEEHLATLTSGFHLVLPGLGHMPGQRSRECWANSIRTFIGDPSSPPDPPCLATLPPVEITGVAPAWLRGN